jgi:WD40 repeat protein
MRIGRYEVLGELGRGGMGIVVRARLAAAPPGASPPTVAIKLLKAEARQGLVRFEREIQLLGSLGDAGFVPLLETGDSPHGPFFVMPLLEGGTLRERLRRGSLPPDEAVALFVILAGALARAHERGIVHRDLKPENIIFDGGGRPFVADLGLAKHLLAEGGAVVPLTKTGEMRGTPGYCPAEQLTDAKTAGKAADVFALGAILYECLTGERAFPGDNALAVFEKVERGSFVGVRRLAPAVPRWLAAVVERALARESRDRFEDAGALGAALARGAGGRRARTVLTLALPCVVAAALGVVLLLRPATPKTTVPPPAPPARGPDLPEDCRGFRSTRLADLEAVMGTYEGNVGDSCHVLAVSPDGRRAFTGGTDGFVRVWDAATGAALGRFEPGVGKDIQGIAVSPDGSLAVARTAGGGAYLWDVPKGRLIQELEGNTGDSRAVAFSPDGKHAVTGSGGGKILLWSTARGGASLEKTWIGQGEKIVNTLIFLPDGQHVASGAAGGAIELRDVTAPAGAGPPLRSLPAHNLTYALAVSRDGRRLLSGGFDKLLKLWDVERALAGGDALLETLAGHGQPVLTVALSPDGRRAISGALENDLRLWDLETGTSQPIAAHRGFLQTVAFLPDGRRALTLGLDRTMRLLEVATGKEVWTHAGHQGPIRSVALTPDGRIALTTGLDQTVRVWDTERASERERFAVDAWPTCVAVSADGKRAAWGDLSGNVTIRDLARGSSRDERAAHPAMVMGIAIAPDGESILSSGQEGALVLRTFAPGTVRRSERSSHGPIYAVAYSPDGKTAIGAHQDGTLTLYDAGTLEAIRSIEGGTGPAFAVAVSPDGKRALSGSNDGQVRLLDLASGTVLGSFANGAPVSGVAFLGAGRGLAFAVDGTIAILALGSMTVDRIDLGSSGDVAINGAATADGRSFVAGTSRGVLLRFRLR